METISEEQLKNLLNDNKKVLVQYTAAWCGPCRALTPRLANISNNYENIEFVKIDVDQSPNSVMELEIRSVPTVVVYNGNMVVDKSTGVQVDSYYKEILSNL